MQEWMYRASAYELLSLAYLPPTREVAEALSAGEMEAACGEVLEALGCNDAKKSEILQLIVGYRDTSAEDIYHDLRKEHAHLFVGEKEALVTPYVGVHAAQQRGQRGLLFVGEESMRIERFMRARGVAKNLSAGQSNDPLDHVGTVCEFLKYLCLVNAHAVQVPEGFVVVADDYDEFLREHFAAYAAWFSEEVRKQTRIPFYQAMGMMLAFVCAV